MKNVRGEGTAAKSASIVETKWTRGVGALARRKKLHSEESSTLPSRKQESGGMPAQTEGKKEQVSS